MNHQASTPSYHDLFALEYGTEYIDEDRKGMLRRLMADMDGFGELTVLTMKFVYDGTEIAGIGGRIRE